MFFGQSFSPPSNFLHEYKTQIYYLEATAINVAISKTKQNVGSAGT